ncbi:hypothetical protein [Glaciecola sp. 1036]|uniref:hypothetical protein n=1 Tax=Alteromonadaceae TaxID=72275 RepID=UPI003CFF190A
MLAKITFFIVVVIGACYLSIKSFGLPWQHADSQQTMGKDSDSNIQLTKELRSLELRIEQLESENLQLQTSIANLDQQKTEFTKTQNQALEEEKPVLEEQVTALVANSTKQDSHMGNEEGVLHSDKRATLLKHQAALREVASKRQLAAINALQ